MSKDGDKQDSNSLVETGSFVIGVNYWASHSGIKMWSDWNPEQIEEDLAIIKSCGMTVVRIFPLWSDFQPIHLLRGCMGEKVDFRFGEDPLPDTEAGQAGISEEMVERFGEFLDILEKYDMTCVIGLVTGWMSGRLFVPPALEGVNPITDPMAVRWEIRFVKYMVNRFKYHKSISAWELGNECNCLGDATRDEAYNWTALISNTVKSIDSSRPFISGMHSLSPNGRWTMFDQAEHTDILTTHPYPIFTQHCGNEPLNTIRPILHSTAESCYYADLSGRPCLCEEFGTLGNMVSSEGVAADYVRSCLFSLWSNDCHGLLWWCASDQNKLAEAPYDWCAVERELGIIRDDKTTKPVAEEFLKFSKFLKSLPFSRLPKCKHRAVCILTMDQDNWGVAYAAFIMAKQAGFDIEFQYSEQPLKDAELYLMPSVTGAHVMSRRRLDVLYEKVRQGSTLYMSIEDGMLSGFEKLTGLEPQSRDMRNHKAQITVDFPDSKSKEFSFEAPRRVNMKATRADILGTDENGNPAFSVAEYGKGKVYFFNAPLEISLSHKPHSFDVVDNPEYWRIYELIADDILKDRKVVKTNSMLAVTEHQLSQEKVAVVVINMFPEKVTDTLGILDGWKFIRSYPENVVESKEKNFIVTKLGKNAAAVYIIQVEK